MFDKFLKNKMLHSEVESQENGIYLATQFGRGVGRGKIRRAFLLKNRYAAAGGLLFFFLSSALGAFGSNNPHQIWVPYVESPQIEFDGIIDTLREWADAGRYDISDLRGSMGDSVDPAGSVFLYASHNSSYLVLGIANLVDSSLGEVGSDRVTLYTDDDNNDTLDMLTEGHYEFLHFLDGDSLVFFPYGAERLVTDFDVSISNLSGHVCFEGAIRLGSGKEEDLDCSEGESFGAWIGVEDMSERGYSGVWPPTSNFLFPNYYGDVYLARPGETPPPSSPSDVTVSVDYPDIPDTVLIQWTNPTLDMVGDSLEGLELIRIYRNEVLIDSAFVQSPGFGTKYEDARVSLARSYSYRLSAVDFDGFESPLTEALYAVPGYLYYSSDLEENDGGWSPTEDWEWGKPQNMRPTQPYSGAKCWGTVLDDYYRENSRSRLTGPAISIENLAVSRVLFYFYHFYETEVLFDGGNVKISKDGGNIWSLLEPEGGYPVHNIWALDNEPGFSGSSGAWTYSFFDLSDYIGEAIEIRFDFGSDGATEFPGWYVDDIAVVANSPSVGIREARSNRGADLNRTALSVSPNPFRASATIAYDLSQPERIGLYVYDLAGRRIATLFQGNQKAGTHSLIWDGTDGLGGGVPSGVYICRLNIGASFKAEKLLLIK